MNPICRRNNRNRSAAGLTLLEVVVAITISGLVALAALASMRIGMRAWEKEQSAVFDMRRVASVQDILHLQLSNLLLRNIVVEVFERRQQMPFFLAEGNRLVFLTSYSALARGRGGIVVADYLAEQQPDQTWKLWLDERLALDDQHLAGWVAGIRSTPDGFWPVLRPFDKARPLLLWEGLRECRFQYRWETPPPGGWFSFMPSLGRFEMPSAVALLVRADETQWKGLAPVPVLVRTGIAGARR